MHTGLRLGRALLRHICRGGWVVGTGLILATLLPGTGQALELMGEYRYARGPLESLEAAKQTTRTNAVRQAIVTSDLFREATATLVDHQLLERLVATIMDNAVEEVEVLAQQVEGRTVHARVRTVLNEQAIHTLIAQERGNTMLRGGEPADPQANRQNRALRILDISEDEERGTVAVVFQALRPLDWMSTAYVGGLGDQADLMITFYDHEGRPLRTDRFPARKSGADDRDALAPGHTATHHFPKPLHAASYDVWVAY
jgi:hypothetical protein